MALQVQHTSRLNDLILREKTIKNYEQTTIQSEREKEREREREKEREKCIT